MYEKVVATNRKAHHEFTIGTSWEAGLSLVGTEVKALRSGKANLSDGWVNIENGQAYLVEVHIGHYSHGNRENHAEKRTRKLLLNKKELVKIESEICQKGFTVVPLKIYFKGRYAKVAIAVAKAKKAHDKRDSIKTREVNRDIARAVRRKA